MYLKAIMDFPGGTVDKKTPASARVPSLVQEDPTCCRAAAHGSQLLSPMLKGPVATTDEPLSLKC